MVVSAFEPSCDMNVVEGSSFWVTIEGHIEPGAEGEQPVFVAELIPAEERLFQVYRGLCPDETIEVKSQLLWRALNILDLETFRVPAENGERSTATYRVRSPTQEEINYDLEITIYVAR